MSSIDILRQRPQYELDSAIFERIEARERRRAVDNDVVSIMEQQTGTYGIVEPLNPGDREGAEVIASSAVTAFASAFQDRHSDPAEAAYQAMEEVNTEAGRTGRGYRATLLQFFQGTDGNVRVASASIGGGQAYLYPKNESGKAIVLPMTEDQDPVAVLDGSDAANQQIKYDVFTVSEGSRIAIASRETDEINAKDTSTAELWLKRVGKRGRINRAAGALVGIRKGERDKVGIVIDVLEEGEIGTVPTGSAARNSHTGKSEPSMRGNRQAAIKNEDSERTGGIRKYLAPLVGGVVLGKLFSRRKNRDEPRRTGRLRQFRDDVGSNWQAYRTNNADKKHRLGRAGMIAGGIGATAIGVQENRRQRWMDRKRAKHNDYYVERQYSEDQIYDDLERRRNNRIVAGTVLAIGGLIAWHFIGDLGQEPRLDKGPDLLTYPFDQGDRQQGDGWGADISWDNRSPVGNDDPTPPHIDKSYDGILPDITPASGPLFADGDGFSWPKWVPWAPDAPVVIQDPGDAGAPPIPAPREPNLGEPIPPPVAGPELPEVPAPEVPAWEPRIWNINSGDGIENLIHNFGHEYVGPQFTGADAHYVYEQLQEQYGNDLFVFADGSDATYTMSDGEAGLIKEGPIMTTNQQIQLTLMSLMDSLRDQTNSKKAYSLAR